MKKDNKNNIKFPIVAYKGNLLHFARNMDEIATCSKRGLKSGFYENLIIVDSSGKEFSLKGAVKIGYVGCFWGINILKGQQLKLDLIIDKESINSLDQLKDKIIGKLKMEKYFWNSDGELAHRLSVVSGAKNHSELIEYLSNYFYNKNTV